MIASVHADRSVVIVSEAHASAIAVAASLFSHSQLCALYPPITIFVVCFRYFKIIFFSATFFHFCLLFLSSFVRYKDRGSERNKKKSVETNYAEKKLLYIFRYKFLVGSNDGSNSTK